MSSFDLYFELLRDWCDGLIRYQLKRSYDKCFDGGILCPACKLMHGRSSDSVYPFTVMARLTGDNKYLEAAEAVFNWGECMMTDIGSMYNDAQNAWQGITVFNAVSLCETLECGKELYSSDTVENMEKRLKSEGEWLYNVLDENYKTNINYVATNACALELLGKYFGRDDYREKAKHLAEYTMARITDDGFLYGEAKPRDSISPLGCRAIDIGYNMEESLPALVKYAYSADDSAMLDKLTLIIKKQLDFMLPDGAWDNSFGTRNNKWTYWGSRTSDGCSTMYTLLADRDPAFAEAAARNTELLRKCTHDGLLYGGPHYKRHGELPCVHHTFEHANAIAFVLMHREKLSGERGSLPIDNARGIRFYPDINIYKIAVGKYRATVTGYDFAVGEGVHASGGTLTMLWSYDNGPMIIGSVMDYKLVEVTNMQLSRKLSKHRPLLPRLASGSFSTAYFTSPEMTLRDDNGCTKLSVKTGLMDSVGKRLDNDTERIIEYTFTENGVRTELIHADDAKFILPLISGELEIISGTLEKKDDIFFLTGGFEATEYTLAPDSGGHIEIFIK